MELPRSRSENQLSLTRGHLHALGAMSLALALLSFFLGVQVGRRQAPPAPEPVAVALVGEEARTGNLEQLLEKVENAQAPPQPLAFPTGLPANGVTVEGVTPPPSLPLPGTGSVPAIPVLGPTGGVVPGGGWAVDVLLTPDAVEAQATLTRIQAAALPGYRLSTFTDGDGLHKVRVGGYANEAAAKEGVAAVEAATGKSGLTVVAAP